MKLLVACRSFDLEHDHRLRKLMAPDSGFAQIALANLDVVTIKAALVAASIEPSAVSDAEIELC